MPDREARKAQITANRRKQILEAALEVFARKGYTAATIPEISKSAGLALGTIYLYYHSKRELFVAVIESMLVSPLLNVFESESESNFKKALNKALIERLAFLQNALLTKLLFLMGDILRDPELRAMFMEKLLCPFLTRMEEFYRIRIDKGEFRSMQPAVTVRTVGAMMLGLNLLKSLEGECSPLIRLSPDQVINEITDLVMYGLSKNSADTPAHIK